MEICPYSLGSIMWLHNWMRIVCIGKRKDYNQVLKVLQTPNAFNDVNCLADKVVLCKVLFNYNQIVWTKIVKINKAFYCGKSKEQSLSTKMQGVSSVSWCWYEFQRSVSLNGISRCCIWALSLNSIWCCSELQRSVSLMVSVDVRLRTESQLHSI